LAPDSALTCPYSLVMSRASSAKLIEPLLIDRSTYLSGEAAESVTSSATLL
jgi:hypothetical protein